jgi:DNA mismatch repair protein MLH1
MLQVDWDAEKECFESFSREMSSFYAIKKSLFASTDENSEQKPEV